MSLDAFLPPAGLALAMVCAGLAFGLVYFVALRLTAARIAEGSGWGFPLALSFSRYGAAIIFLGFAARLGALSLLSAFVGFLAARALALRSARQNE